MMISLFFIFLFFITTMVSHAGEGSVNSAHEQITFIGDWLPRLINFVIIAAVVVYFSRKPIRDFFKNRSLDIAKAIQESKDAKERAVSDLAEMERKVKDFEVEMQKMISDAQARGEKDKLVLVEEGRKIVQEIQQQVKQNIEMEVRKAKDALATEASLLSINLAEGKIRESIRIEDQESIIKEYITKVGGKG